ncbi:hypothetical protein RIB2604_02701810 [Aspergillus luchuensis]|uniref:Uncharacterized protein n=1 Tax=Aspergillus kawachii TaxID=1069201 RepID=A0A146FTW4_ASPKA|nr:hypothetical protein RIB2604_02701810 [Aspergillus luchuensis]
MEVKAIGSATRHIATQDQTFESADRELLGSAERKEHHPTVDRLVMSSFVLDPTKPTECFRSGSGKKKVTQ